MMLEETPLRKKTVKEEKSEAPPFLRKATSEEYLEDDFESFYSDNEE